MARERKRTLTKDKKGKVTVETSIHTKLPTFGTINYHQIIGDKGPNDKQNSRNEICNRNKDNYFHFSSIMKISSYLFIFYYWCVPPRLLYAGEMLWKGCRIMVHPPVIQPSSFQHIHGHHVPEHSLFVTALWMHVKKHNGFSAGKDIFEGQWSASGHIEVPHGT